MFRLSTARAQWHREETVVQTANEDKAAHLIDYARQLWDNQDDFLKQRHPLVRRSTFTLAWEGGGEVPAIPSGPDQIRAFHPTRHIQDEAAFLPDGEEFLSAVIPARSVHHLHFDGAGRMVRRPMQRMSLRFPLTLLCP